MANEITKIRTNFVEITDLDAFRSILESCVVCNGESITIIENTENNVTKYGFYVEEDIDGIRERDESCNAESCAECKDAYECDVDCSYDAFLKELQQVIAPGDALIITAFCYEKMCYLKAFVDIVTHDSIDAVTLEKAAFNKAREMLGNENWTTQNYYGRSTKFD